MSFSQSGFSQRPQRNREFFILESGCLYVNQPLIGTMLNHNPPSVLMRVSRKAVTRNEFLAKGVLAETAEEQRFFYFGNWILPYQSAAIRDDAKP